MESKKEKCAGSPAHLIKLKGDARSVAGMTTPSYLTISASLTFLPLSLEEAAGLLPLTGGNLL